MSPKTDSMSRTNGVQGLQGFELLVECSYAAREAVIQVDDLEDLLLREEQQPSSSKTPYLRFSLFKVCFFKGFFLK